MQIIGIVNNNRITGVEYGPIEIHAPKTDYKHAQHRAQQINSIQARAKRNLRTRQK